MKIKTYSTTLEIINTDKNDGVIIIDFAERIGSHTRKTWIDALIEPLVNGGKNLTKEEAEKVCDELALTSTKDFFNAEDKLENNNLSCGVNRELCPKEEINLVMLEALITITKDELYRLRKSFPGIGDNVHFHGMREIWDRAFIVKIIERATSKKIEDVLKKH